MLCFEYCSYLLVSLSSKSQRSSATRKTDFNLLGSEMEWTWAFSMSNMSNWLLQQRRMKGSLEFVNFTCLMDNLLVEINAIYLDSL